MCNSAVQNINICAGYECQRSTLTAFLVNKLYDGANIDDDGRDYCKPNNILAPFLLACTLTFPENEKFYPFMYFIEKLSMTIQSKIKYLIERKRILININGGFIPWDSNLKAIQSTVSNKFPQFSIDDIKISKWPSGKHFYATLNGESIKVDGLNKWSTEKNAMVAVKKWFKDGNKG